MSPYWKSTGQRVLEWVTRRRSPPVIFANLGFLLCVACASGFVFNLAVRTPAGEAKLSVSPSEGLPTEALVVGFFVGLFIMVSCKFWEISRERHERERMSRKRVIALEVRGLRDFRGAPLADAIPAQWEGRRESMLVDLRQISDGAILQPDAAIDQLLNLPKELNRRCLEGDRSDVTVVYAGLASVPFTFLTGILLDDEGTVHVMDWDRNQKVWRILDGFDDGERFDMPSLDTIEPGTPEVGVAVSVSYDVDIEGVQLKLPGVPLIQLRLSHGGADSHWSLEKQRGLGRQFLQTMIALGNKGVQKIHLFLAAQNSVVFTFGQIYDKRNLPAVVVYQYEKHRSPPYPWGISMPVSGETTATVV